MGVAQRSRRVSFERSRAELSARLRARREEIEQAVLTRAFALSDANQDAGLDSLDPEYLEGLRTAIAVAVDYGLAVIERGEERAPAPPPALLAQARLAARYGIGLDTVLRRYSAGYVLLYDFLIDEAERSGLRGAELKRLLRAQAALDRLLAAVSEEYSRETSERPATSEERRAERVDRLLAGEPIDTSELAYDFECSHLGAIAVGAGALDALRDLAVDLGCRLLAVRRDEGVVWAWLGTRRTIDPEQLKRRILTGWPPGCPIAIGEPATGLAGWRLSHNQARAALSVAMRGPDDIVRYADVALLATILQDDLLRTSLEQLYLQPLESERGGSEAARKTLRAYFAAGMNVSSAAAALGVNRNTVASRLRAIESVIGRSLASCGAELDASLRWAELTEAGGAPRTWHFAGFAQSD